MVGSRTVTAIAGLLLGLLVSVVLWWRFDTLAFFLFLPFVPFLFPASSRDESAEPEAPVRTCPSCGFRTTNSAFDYCPRDGRRLEVRDR